MDKVRHYELRNKDHLVCSFSLEPDKLIPSLSNIRLCEVVDNSLMQAILCADERDLAVAFQDFPESRKLCKSRGELEGLMDAWGMKNLETYLDISYGLSFIDTLWIRPARAEIAWEDVSLFRHEFNEVIAHLAFTGQGLQGIKMKTTSPEFGTNGMLPKCWHRTGEVIQLYKGGMEGDWKGPVEPLMEYYACQVAKVMGLDYVDYQVAKYRNHLVSVCDIFTSEKYGYRQISDYLPARGNVARSAVEVYQKSGYLDALYDMLLFDAIICNTDRHFGNFGLLIDNDTYQPVKAAPIFDNGMSLGARCQAGDNPTLEEYIKAANAVGSSCFGDFIPFAKWILDARRAAIIRPLLEFEFVEHPQYKMKYPTLDNMNALVQHQVREILGKF